MTPIRVQRSRKKGSKLPPNTVCVSRGTKYGNPFRVVQMPFDGGWAVKCSDNEKEMSVIRQNCSASYDTKESATRAAVGCYIVIKSPFTHLDGTLLDLIKAIQFHTEIKQDLKGKNLACWCKVGEPCHGDWLLEIANEPIV